MGEGLAWGDADGSSGGVDREVTPGCEADGFAGNTAARLLSFPRFFAFQPDGIMPPILAHADA
jgi:hypothetical protein